MSTSGHINLPSCHVVGERATSLPTLPHKTDVVASVLPAPSVRGCVTGEQLAQATKVVLNKTISCYLTAQQHCCTMIFLMTDGYVEFLGIKVVDMAKRTTVFHSIDSNFALYSSLCFDGKNKCFHALLHGERVVLHVVLIGADDALSHYDTDCTLSPNERHNSCQHGVCDLSYHAINGDTHVSKFLGLCCRLVISRMTPSVFLSLTTYGSSGNVSVDKTSGVLPTSTSKFGQELKTSSVEYSTTTGVQDPNISTPRIHISRNGNCMVSTDSVFDEQATFRLPGILRNLTLGDFVYDKTLGLMAYHEFWFLTCSRWAQDHLYPLDGFEVRSSLALADSMVVFSLNAMAVTQCEISVDDQRRLHCIVQDPTNPP